MRDDRRQIQTAVLGSVDSQEPLALPLEAIELDAFRKRYQGQSFWCGTWLGGCGRQLTTKLYVDRVCHFAHHPDPDSTRSPCARRARDVTSADHLYVRAAAESLLRTQGLPGEVTCSPPRPGQATAGSVVRVQLEDGSGLTIHMSPAVPPDWDDPQAAARTVVEAGVLLDRAALQRLRYVHRIRCDSQGTSRRVQIGTETARGTQWFSTEQCSLSSAGLMTPALTDLPDRPIARPPSRSQDRPQGRPARISEEIRHLLLRLATARRGRDIALTRRLIKECDGVLSRRAAAPTVLKEARDSAERWLSGHSKEVVAQGRPKGRVVVLTGKTAAQEKKKREHEAQQAALQCQEYLLELAPALEQERFGDARALLRAISQLPDTRMPLTRAQVDLLRGARERVYGQKLGAFHDQVARRKWLARHCPACRARAGKECFDDLPEGRRLRRFGGHAERLRLVIEDREKEAARKRARGGGKQPAHSRGTTAEDLAHSVARVPCPTCNAGAGKPCTVPGSHPARLRRLQQERP